MGDGEYARSGGHRLQDAWHGRGGIYAALSCPTALLRCAGCRRYDLRGAVISISSSRSGCNRLSDQPGRSPGIPGAYSQPAASTSPAEGHPAAYAFARTAVGDRQPATRRTIEAAVEVKTCSFRTVTSTSNRRPQSGCGAPRIPNSPAAATTSTACTTMHRAHSSTPARTPRHRRGATWAENQMRVSCHRENGALPERR